MSQTTKISQPKKITTLQECLPSLKLLHQEEQSLLKGGSDYYYYYNYSCSCKEKRVRVRRYYDY